MKYYSTHNRQHTASLKEAVLRGLAPDGGLYMPERIPTLTENFIKSLNTRSFADNATVVAAALFGEDLPANELQRMVNATIHFDAPLQQVEDNCYALELFHGPTAAFKDFGARFMSQMLGYFAQHESREITILAATSGDTGSAVANGFLGVPGTKVVVLYPAGKVSEIQEKQFTTLGQNITALEVSGTFDDCQRLVKAAFLDEALNRKLVLTSANSINLARLLPQTFYYFHAVAQLNGVAPVIAVPSGNFGNITAGLIARNMGLPIAHFVAATNVNDVVPHYLRNKVYEPRPSVATISNAMDVGNPSNFARMLELYGHDAAAMGRDITGYSFADIETRSAMQSVFANRQYTMDPHGAVGYLGLREYFQHHGSAQPGIFLETAHPAKFKETVEATIQQPVAIPATLERFMRGTKKTVPMGTEFSDFRDYLLSR